MRDRALVMVAGSQRWWCACVWRRVRSLIILFRIVAEVAAKPFMVNFEIRHRATRLTSQHRDVTPAPPSPIASGLFGRVLRLIQAGPVCCRLKSGYSREEGSRPETRFAL
jgi:hypothetical protein